MNEADYNERQGVRRSELWVIKDSPEKYWWRKNNPEEPTQALLFGAMVHKMLLEPRTFKNEYILYPNIDRRTKAGREEFQAFVEQAGDRTLISTADYDIAKEMVKMVKWHPIAKELIKGRHEVPIFWTDDITGEICKVKLDVLKGRKDPIVIDYKTAMNAQTEAFNHSIFKYGYYLQAFMYSEAVRIKYKLDKRPDFIFIVQEKKAPYSVNVIKVMDDVMAAGEDCFRELIGIYHQCRMTGYWYGYNGPFNEISEAWLPGYMSDSIGDEE